MSTPVSPTAICNLAFDYIKEATASNIEAPQSEIESLAARHYDITRQMVLRSFPWSFARSRRTLARNSTNPSGYQDAYDLPNDFLKLLFVGSNYNTTYETAYSIEGQQILIDNGGGETLSIGYVRNEVDVRTFDPMFTKLLAAELAVIFAAGVTGKPSMVNMVKSFRDDIEQKAKAANGQENPVKVRYESKYVSARALSSSSGGTEGIPRFQV